MHFFADHYELMTSFPSTSDVSKSAILNDDVHAYAFALENESAVELKSEFKKQADGFPAQSFSSSFPNEYEEIEFGRKQEFTNEYEIVEPVSSSVYTNMQNSPTFKGKSVSSVDDATYKFATEIPSIGIPSVYPSLGSTITTKKEKYVNKETDSVCRAQSSGNIRSQTVHTKGAPCNFPCNFTDETVQEIQNNSSKQSPVFLKHPAENAFFSNENVSDLS